VPESRQAAEKPSSPIERVNASTFSASAFTTLARLTRLALLDKGVPVHVVAKRCGHDPATLLRYDDARRTKKADAAVANVIGTLWRASP
jgi:hypothetical protein